MRHVAAVLVRLAVLGLALVLFARSPLAATDALAAGLLAFAGLVVASGAWASVDGTRHGLRTALVRWAAVAVLLALGWWVAFAATQRDSTMSFTELLASDAASIPFVIGLVLVPAVAGAALGAAAGRVLRSH